MSTYIEGNVEKTVNHGMRSNLLVAMRVKRGAANGEARVRQLSEEESRDEVRRFQFECYVNVEEVDEGTSHF